MVEVMILVLIVAWLLIFGLVLVAFNRIVDDAHSKKRRKNTIDYNDEYYKISKLDPRPEDYYEQLYKLEKMREDNQKALDKSFLGVSYKITNGSFFQVFTFVSILVGAVGLIVFLFVIGIVNIAPKRQIEKTQITYNSLIKRLEIVNSDYEDVSKSDVIKDIAKWNEMVCSEKYWGNNHWTNWFFCKEVVDQLEVIDYESKR